MCIVFVLCTKLQWFKDEGDVTDSMREVAKRLALTFGVEFKRYRKQIVDLHTYVFSSMWGCGVSFFLLKEGMGRRTQTDTDRHRHRQTRAHTWFRRGIAFALSVVEDGVPKHLSFLELVREFSMKLANQVCVAHRVHESAFPSITKTTSLLFQQLHVPCRFFMHLSACLPVCLLVCSLSCIIQLCRIS